MERTANFAEDRAREDLGPHTPGLLREAGKQELPDPLRLPRVLYGGSDLGLAQVFRPYVHSVADGLIPDKQDQSLSVLVDRIAREVG